MADISNSNVETQDATSDELGTDVRASDAADEADDEKIIERAKACLALAEEAERQNRVDALDDLEFSVGNQWPDAVKREREIDGRPCLVINRIPQFVQQVTNDQRQNRPAIKVHAVSDGADEQTANKIQGLIRHIEYNSNAEVAYDTAFESAAKGGFGYYRIVTDYAGPMSFDQEIFIKRITNPFSVFLDPSAQEPDGSDANWGLIVEDLPKEQYELKFPNSKLCSLDWDSLGNQPATWLKEGSARVAEFFYKVWEEKKIHLLSTGEVVEDENLLSRLAQAQAAGIDVRAVKSRLAKIPKVKWLKLNAVEKLDHSDWPGKYIPIVPVYGNETHINGRKILAGIIRNAKDPQRMLNYWKSAETEAIALAPRAPYLVAEGSVEPYAEMWKTANKRNHAFLVYKPTSVTGKEIPMPQRQSFEPAVQAITNAAMFAADDLKATTGIYDASLGSRGNETSGVAIQRRNNQAQTANFHFVDNLTRSLRHTGRILIDLIPRIYDTPRSNRIVGEDGKQTVVKFNEVHKDESGKDVIYALDAGTYDVTVDVGPSFASKRQEAAASMMEITQANPSLWSTCGDIMVKNMDWQGATEISERLKKMLPPALQDDPAKGGKDIPPQVQAQLAQQGQMIEQLTAQLKDTSEAMRTKKLELDSRERIEMAKLETTATIEMAKLESREAIELLAHQIAELDQRQKQMFGMGAQQPQPAEQEQDFVQQDDGAFGADVALAEQAPTGGISPGSTMEGISSDD